MKNSLKKELKTFGILLLIGAVIGGGWVLLQHFGIVAPPENPREFNWRVIAAAIGGGLIGCLGITIIVELFRKHSKTWAIEEKDERNFALSRRAGSTAWLLNIVIITYVIIFCIITGHEPSVLTLGCIGIANIVCFVGAMDYHNKKM